MIEFHDAWILKAENDLKAAEIMVRRDDPITDVAIYHTQQCAEKALKGFLAYRRSEIQKIHNLAELVIQCSAFDPTFRTLLSDADNLTPKGTEFRYPDDPAKIDDIYWSRIGIPVIFDSDGSCRSAACVIRRGTSSGNGRSPYTPLKSLQTFRNTYYKGFSS